MTDQASVSMSKPELEALIRKSVKDGVKDAFLMLGMDVSTPEGVLEAQRDMQHLRGWRRAKETVTKQGLIVACTTIFSGIVAALYLKYGGGK